MTSSVQQQRELMLVEMTKMNTNFENFIKQNGKDHKELKDGQDKQNGRVRKNSEKIAYIIGAGSTAITIITILNALGVL